MRCERCGRESGDARLFASISRRYVISRKTLCQSCQLLTRTKIEQWCMAIAVLALGLGGFIGNRDDHLGQFFILLLLLQIAGLVAHEFAHILAAKLVRFEVLSLELGAGSRICHFKFLGADIILRPVPTRGSICAIARTRSNWHFRKAIVLIAGPMVNLLLLQLALWEVFRGGGSSGLPLWPAMAMANAILLISSLLPIRYGSEFSPHATDGAQLLQFAKIPAPRGRHLKLLQLLALAHADVSSGRYNEAVRHYQTALELAPHFEPQLLDRLDFLLAFARMNGDVQADLPFATVISAPTENASPH